MQSFQLRHHRDTVQGLPMHWVEAGDAGKPIVVLIHGIGVSERYFRPLIEVLAQEYHVLAPDMPGFGRSQKPGRRMGIADYAHLMGAWLRQLGIERSLLVGHSMGCQVVAAMIAQDPQMAHGLVLIGPTVDKYRRRLRHQAARLLLTGFRESPRATATVLSDYLRCGPRHYARTVRPMLNDRIEECVAGSLAPVLVIRGRRDVIARQPWSRYLAAQAAAGRLVEIAKAGHMVQYTRPDAVATAIREFIPS